jgi:hypothetical protein
MAGDKNFKRFSVKMRYNFCTLFDSYYLTRGIALYRSLDLHCDNFHLYIFSFDDRSYAILEKLNLTHATIISLKSFENEDLLRVKPTRTIAEYCWTCTAAVIWYSIATFKLDHCTYLDADIQFFSSPDAIFAEMKGSSVGISPHNFSANLKSSEVCGKYCVQFTYFKNDADGLKALSWWKDSCLEWCYAKMEDGKYGDQKYLDYFQQKFNNVHDISNIGAGVAPWNISDYNIELNGNDVLVELKEKPGKKSNLIFYHYQALKFDDSGSEVIAKPAFLKIQQDALKYIYEPYIGNLISIKNTIEGNKQNPKKIIFQRKLMDAIGIYIRVKLRGFGQVRKIYYRLKKSKFNRPDNIGSSIE